MHGSEDGEGLGTLLYVATPSSLNSQLHLRYSARLVKHADGVDRRASSQLLVISKVSCSSGRDLAHFGAWRKQPSKKVP